MHISNHYAELGSNFSASSPPLEVRDPRLLLWNSALASELGISNELQNNHSQLAAYFSGNDTLPGSMPIATAYAGHQFGSFNPQLGDGRAHLLGEVKNTAGTLQDIQLKGSGQTPYSRGGDGRCAVGPAVREFIMSEAMQALGVPTTRCLAVVTTGEEVFRDTVKTGAVVTRIAASHLRVGSFQFFAARDDKDALEALFNFAVERHYPEIKSQPGNRYLLFMEKVIEKQIKLVVEWSRVGFIHGVMNTDNTAISGETIDFGPCAMLGTYHPETVYSSIDHAGRYAFGNQPNIANWNVARLAECLLLLIGEDDSQSIKALQSMIGQFQKAYMQEFEKMMGRKLGLFDIQQTDVDLLNELLQTLHNKQLDYTRTFNGLTNSLSSGEVASSTKDELGDIFEAWEKRISEQDQSTEDIQQLMRGHNPVVIPRNHHVEAVLNECETTGDATSAERLLEVLRSPYAETPDTKRYQSPPEDDDVNYQTFCGT